MSKRKISNPFDLQVNLVQKCRKLKANFEKLNQIDEGTYGIVFRARDRESQEIVAIKEIKMNSTDEGFPLSSFREIQILLLLKQENLIKVQEIVYEKGGIPRIFIVMEYMDHELKQLLREMKENKRNAFSVAEIKCLIIQLCEGLTFLHENWIIHRDLKTSNVLFNNRGILKICDFGMARKFGNPIRQYTLLVVTLWYRAPELLLGSEIYDTKIDVWSIGCVIAELFLHECLFRGSSEVDQIHKIFDLLGVPFPEDFPELKLPSWMQIKSKNDKKLKEKLREVKFNFSNTSRAYLTDCGLNFVKRMLTPSPEKRARALDLLKDSYLEEFPRPQKQELMPSFAATNSTSHEVKRSIRSVEWRPHEVWNQEDHFQQGLRVNSEAYLKKLDELSKKSSYIINR